MSKLLGPDYEPRVLQFARYNASAEDNDDLDYLHYLRVSCKLSTFLLQDTGKLSEDIGPLERNSDANETREPEKLQSGHRCVELKHETLPVSAALFNPEHDVLWFSHEIDDDDVKEMAPYYGSQLRQIYNVLFEETEWDATECLKRLEHFTGVQVIYVWLDSYRFQPGATVTTEEEYAKKAEHLRLTDEAIFQGRDLLVKYIDDNHTVYGGEKR